LCNGKKLKREGVSLMPYLDGKGYCRKCKRVTPHRYSLRIKCFNCKLESTQQEYNEGIKDKK
jgi:hypothetical protein